MEKPARMLYAGERYLRRRPEGEKTEVREVTEAAGKNASARRGLVAGVGKAVWGVGCVNCTIGLGAGPCARADNVNTAMQSNRFTSYPPLQYHIESSVTFHLHSSQSQDKRVIIPVATTTCEEGTAHSWTVGG